MLLNFTRYKNRRAKAFALLLLSGMLLASPQTASAEGFSLQNWSARGAALQSGLVARGGDASAVAYNPAAITELPGTQISVGMGFVSPTNTITGLTASGYQSQTSEDLLFVVPNAYITHKLNDDFSFGFGLFSRFGLGNEYDENWFGRYDMYSVQLLTTTFNPVLAWRVNDNLSLAGGVEISAAQVDLEKKIYMGAIPDSNFAMSHTGVSYGLGFNLAAHYRFNEQWKAGLTYRSGVTYDFDGRADVTYYNGTVVANSGSTSLSMPDQITLALAYSPIEKLSFEGQVAYYVWSNYEELVLDIPAMGGDLVYEKNWKDTWFFSLSAEYEALDWLTLRAGISRETSAIESYSAEYMTPTNGRWNYSIGAGFHKGAWTVDLAYVYHDLDKTNFSASSTVYDGYTSDTYAHEIAIGVGYKF